MRQLTRTSLCGAVLMALAACASVKVTRVGTAPARPSVPMDSVRLFYSREAVPFRYDEVAVLSTNVDWLTDDREEIYREFRKKAGDLGANAIIVAPIDDPTTGEKVTSVFFGAGGLSGQALAVFLHLADTVATPR